MLLYLTIETCFFKIPGTINIIDTFIGDITDGIEEIVNYDSGHVRPDCKRN